MDSTLFFVCILFTSVASKVSAIPTVNGVYGETVEVPCNKGDAEPEEILICKWKYYKGDGSTGDLLVKTPGHNASVNAGEEYQDRVSMSKDLSLLIANAALTDQNVYTCMVVVGSDIYEYPVRVAIQKAPSAPEISEPASVMEIGTLSTLGVCDTRDAYPAANITWYKEGILLQTDGEGVIITSAVELDQETGLFSTFSTLQYSALKEDMNAKFTCAVQHSLASDLVSSPVSFSVTYPTEKVSLQVLSQGPFKEGDNVTLKCKADGNPPPSSFTFNIKGEKVTVEDSDIHMLIHVTRADSGEYKCSLVDNEDIEASVNISVGYLDVNFSPSGKLIKSAGEALDVTPKVDASGDFQISWTKDGAKLSGQPKFEKLKYSDSGIYECVVSMAGLVKRDSFELTVEGAAVVKSFTEHRSDDNTHKVLTCEAEGSPKPTVLWSVNGSDAVESPYVDGLVTYSIKITPSANLSVSCSVSNTLGRDDENITVSMLSEKVAMDRQEDQAEESGDQAKVAAGVVIGLILATLIIGLAYWLYMKKSRQGSWKTGEKEDGTLEESKKLEEASQKAEV